MNAPASFAASWLKLAATPTAARIGRTLVEHSLRMWGLGHLADPAKLIVSELLTNAVRATGITNPNPTFAQAETLAVVAVQIRVHGRTLLVEVWDNSTTQPTPRAADDDAENGRGLLLVEMMSDHWGVDLPTCGGKIVFAELNIDTCQEPLLLWQPVPPAAQTQTTTPAGASPQHLMADQALMERLFGDPVRT